jgi:hypothetical protein
MYTERNKKEKNIAVRALMTSEFMQVRLATGWTVRGSNPGGGEIFRTRPDRPCNTPSLLYDGYRVFSGAKVAGAWC